MVACGTLIGMKVRGFTLIELLVVISIIGMLSSVVLSSVNTARAKSRDARRLSDIHQIQIALTNYYADNGIFPPESTSNAGSTGRICNGCTGGINAVLQANGLPNLPSDPLNNNTTYYYYYDGQQGCGGQPNVAVVFVRTLESYPSNYNSVGCTSWGGEGGAGNISSYMVVLGPASP